jgi:hypothetical protein
MVEARRAQRPAQLLDHPEQLGRIAPRDLGALRQREPNPQRFQHHPQEGRQDDRDLQACCLEPDNRDGRGDDQQRDQHQHDAKIRVAKQRHQQHPRAVAGGFALCLLVKPAYQGLEFFVGHRPSLPVPASFLLTLA